MKKIFIIVFLILNLNLFADSSIGLRKFHEFTPGLIFNTNNLLLDIDEYQSGVGIKLMSLNFSIRALLSLNYESGNNVFNSRIGFALEKPFFTGRIAPYWGVSLTSGLTIDKDEYSGDDWRKTRTISADISAILGTEVYIFEFLSFFAEYKLGAGFSSVNTTQEISGNRTENSAINYNIGTELGNEASIGVVIYLIKYKSINK